MFYELLPVLQERAMIKKKLLEEELEDKDMFERMRHFKPVFIFIDDVHEFMEAVYKPDEGVAIVSGFLENITEKGRFYNLFLFATVDYTKNSQSIGYKAFTNMLSYKTGIHLGGNVAAQKIFEFNGMNYTEQSKATRPGIGLLPSDSYGSSPRKVVIPLVR